MSTIALVVSVLVLVRGPFLVVPVISLLIHVGVGLVLIIVGGLHGRDRVEVSEPCFANISRAYKNNVSSNSTGYSQHKYCCEQHNADGRTFVQRIESFLRRERPKNLVSVQDNP